MVLDHYRDRWFQPNTNPYQPTTPTWPSLPPEELDKKYAELLEKINKENAKKANDEALADIRKRLAAQEELNAVLRVEFEEMKKLLVRAKDYDVRNNEPDCEVDEKVQLMLSLAKLLNVDPGKVLMGEAK